MGSDIEIALSSCDEFLKKFNYASQLKLYALRNPEYAVQFIEMVLHYPEINQKLITSWDDLVRLATISPAHGKIVLQKNLESENSQVFHNKTPTNYEWTCFYQAIEVFPEYMENLLRSALNDLALFQKLVPCAYALFDIDEKFPELNYVQFILAHKEEFQRVIPDAFYLDEFIRRFPSYGEEARQYSFNGNGASEPTAGLGVFQLEILETLAGTGLTAAHLRNWHGPQYFSRAHGDALKYLIQERKFSPENAVAELCGLEYFQAEGIMRGLSRKDVFGLQIFQVQAVEEFKKHGVTSEQFQGWQGYFSLNHHFALKHLLEERHLQPKAAITRLCNMTEAEVATLSDKVKTPKAHSLVQLGLFTVLSYLNPVTRAQDFNP